MLPASEASRRRTLEGAERERENMGEPTHIRCEEALRRLMEFVDGELSEADHQSVEGHLRTCRSCYSRMEFERRLKDKLAAESCDYVSLASRDRIRELIRRL